jgi:simple sugar transport system ATP-binding protein/ribose transport system ATP-binding protein
MSDTQALPIRLVGIGKRYSGTKALDDVSLDIVEGSVHALVGANGAGKSTLGKIIGGNIRPDEGVMEVHGRPVKYVNPSDARADGIAMIAQELALVPHLTVMQNVFLGVEPKRRGMVVKRRMKQQYSELVSRWGFSMSRDALVGGLRTADQQKVEILRAVACNARVIVMDEPTSSLTHVETRTLHEMIRDLRESGTTIVYVSHFLDEVLELADSVTVLRNGKLVRTASAADETEASLVSGMFGAAAEAEHFEKPERSSAKVVFEARGLQREGVINDVSFSIHQGEIVGLAGLVGSGRTELARAIAGADPLDAGWIFVDGQECKIRTPRDAIDAGIAFLPESRKKDGLFMELSLAANTTFTHTETVSRRGFMRPLEERRKARALLQALSVVPPSPAVKANSLSGGNQQKVLFARWLFKQPRVLLLDEPTRGVDVGARAAIHRLINDLAREGAAILMISSELEEVLGLAHRVLVIRRGAIVREFQADPALGDVMEAAFGLPGSAA